jgi:DnaA-homolog protein
VPEQLTFELAPPESPSFENFLPDGNEEVVDALRRVAHGQSADAGVVVWGATGAGKSHLLRAAVDAAARAGRPARYVHAPQAAPAEPHALGALIAVDDVASASADAQGDLFTLYNAVAATRGQLIVAASAPPARLDLRPDLRTRLGHGLVYEVQPLADAAKPAALARYSAGRGFALDPAVIDYLLVHYARDMASLLRALSALDRHSLARKRAITVPFVRDLLGRLLS